jgi:hypothetical protein
MKSIDTLSHIPSGIGNGSNNPSCFFIEFLILLASQTSLHIFLCIVLQIKPIVGFLEECCGALCTTMAYHGTPSKVHPQASLPKHRANFAYTTIVRFASANVI